MNDWEIRRCQYLVHELVALCSIALIVRRIIEFNGKHGRQIAIAKNEVEMLAIDPIEVRPS